MRSNQHFSLSDFTQERVDVPPPRGNYTFMIVFAVEYSKWVSNSAYALFNVFAGPVFSNIIAGELLDCVIWGVSPMLFWWLQRPLARFIRSGTNPYRRRFCLLLALTAGKLLAYSFLSYSESFKWNYFTRVFNLDFGYVLLDLSCKSIYFIFVEEQAEDAVGEDRRANLLSLKFSFVGHVTCYAVAFYFALLFSEQHQKSLQACCLVAGLVSLPIPGFYYIKNRHSIRLPAEMLPVTSARKSRKHNLQYSNLAESDRHVLEPNSDGLFNEQQFDSPQKEPPQKPITRSAIFQLAASFFMQSSLTVNLSYSTFWIMDGLLKRNVNESTAFTTSIMYGSMFFGISTLLYLVSGYAVHYLGTWVRIAGWAFNVCYAALLIECYLQFSVGSVCLVILLTGFQLALANTLEDNNEESTTTDVNTLAEFVMYCLVPVYIQFGLDSQDVRVYMLVSGFSCVLSTICSLLA